MDNISLVSEYYCIFSVHFLFFFYIITIVFHGQLLNDQLDWQFVIADLCIHPFFIILFAVKILLSTLVSYVNKNIGNNILKGHLLLQVAVWHFRQWTQNCGFLPSYYYFVIWYSSQSMIFFKLNIETTNNKPKLPYWGENLRKEFIDKLRNLIYAWSFFDDNIFNKLESLSCTIF